MEQSENFHVFVIAIVIFIIISLCFLGNILKIKGIN